MLDNILSCFNPSFDTDQSFPIFGINQDYWNVYIFGFTLNIFGKNQTGVEYLGINEEDLFFLSVYIWSSYSEINGKENVGRGKGELLIC